MRPQPAMPVLQIVSAEPLVGKTTVAAGLARGLASAGSRVQLLRTGAGEAAAADAETFASLTFVSSPGQPVAVDRIAAGGGSELVLVEADAGASPLPGAPAVLVVRRRATEADSALASSLGDRLVGTVATLVPAANIEAVARDLTNAGLRPLALLPEDWQLAAPGVAELREALGADVLYDGENGLDVVESVVVAPIYSDPASPHFRRFQSKAILTPSRKSDLLIAAIESQAACVIATGGAPPSGYVLDRAQGGGTTLLLAQQTTPEAVNALGDVWAKSRFRGDLKVAAVARLFEGRVDFASLAKKLG